MASYHHIALDRFGLLNDSPSPTTRVFSEDPTDEASAAVRQLVESTQTPEGELYFTGFRSDVSLRSADVDDLSQGDTYQSGQTGVKLVGIVGDFFVLFHQDTRIRVAERLDVTTPNLAEADYMMRREGGGRGGHGAIITRNLLTYLQEEDSSGNLAGGWADTDSDNIADGYTATDTTSESFSSGVQEFFVDTGDGSGSINVTVPFPLDNIKVTLSANHTQVHDDGSQAIRIEALDSNGSVLSGGTSDTSVSSTGRKHADLTTPTGTHQLKLYPARVTSVSANNSKAKVKDPALRLNGSTTYVQK